MNKINKIIIIGNANSTFTKGFIENVLLDKQIMITLICERNDLFKDFYKDNNIKVIAIRENSRFENVAGLRTLHYLFNVCKKLITEKADLVIIHYAWAYLLFVYAILNLKIKTILVYWGSDLLRASKKELNIAKKAVVKADRIVLLTEEMKRIFIEQYGTSFENKIQLIDFGISAFSSIDKIQSNSFKRSELIGQDNSDTVTLTIGYNARPEQQHEKVTLALSTLSDNDKKRLVLIYPMTYPWGNDDYINKISCLAKSLGFNIIVIKDYMNEESIAKLCCSTDIFIHAQTTDSLSTSMIEQLYSGSIVLNGEWLKYSFLDNMSIEYKQFNFENLPSIISKIINEPIHKISGNKKKLKDNCSWDKCKSLWNDLLDNL